MKLTDVLKFLKMIPEESQEEFISLMESEKELPKQEEPKQESKKEEPKEKTEVELLKEQISELQKLANSTKVEEPKQEEEKEITLQEAIEKGEF